MAVAFAVDYILSHISEKCKIRQRPGFLGPGPGRKDENES